METNEKSMIGIGIVLIIIGLFGFGGSWLIGIMGLLSGIWAIWTGFSQAKKIEKGQLPHEYEQEEWKRRAIERIGNQTSRI